MPPPRFVFLDDGFGSLDAHSLDALETGARHGRRTLSVTHIEGPHRPGPTGSLSEAATPARTPAGSTRADEQPQPRSTSGAKRASEKGT